MTEAERSRLMRKVNTRIPEANQYSENAVIGLVELHDAFMGKLYGHLSDVMGTEKAIDDVSAHDWGTEKTECCGSHHKAAFTPREVSAIERQFRKIVGENAATQILNDAELWEALAAGTSSPQPDSPLSRNLLPTIKAAARWAIENARKVWEKTFGRKPLAARPPIVFAEITATMETEWINTLNVEGYNLVKDKIKLDYLPNIMKIINDGVQDFKPYNTIVKELRDKMQFGKRWDWIRLVRTEMGTAIHATNVRQMSKSGVPFVQWSASRASGVCPICQGLNGNIYFIDSVPIRPHPNCRCVVVATWRKPTENLRPESVVKF